MKKEFKVEGMMCNHCRMHVEKALNSMEGIHATVTLNPPVATVEFSDGEKTLEELQKVVTRRSRRLHTEGIRVKFIRFSYRKEGGNQSKYLPLRANLQIKI